MKAFTARSHCLVMDIQEAAGLDEVDYYRWLNGRAPDHCSTRAAIENILSMAE